MKKQYYYKTIASMNYNEWAEAASQSWETPVLPKYTAEQLEDIFSKEEWSTSEVRDSVVR